jgi:hypothetical protein
MLKAKKRVRAYPRKATIMPSPTDSPPVLKVHELAAFRALGDELAPVERRLSAVAHIGCRASP